MNCDPDFEPLLANYHPAVLDSSQDTIFGLRPDLTLAYFNQGWTDFAIRNGGEPQISRDWTLGRNIQDAIPLVLQSFFSHNFARCLEQQRPWEHLYECSSADLYRRFIMTAYPLKSAKGFLIVNSLIQEVRHNRTAGKPLEENYRTSDGLIIQCCHCRRVRRNGSDNAWDWVPDWVAAFPPHTSHGLCEPCFGFYFPSK
jgi:hypothetical protein